MKAAISPRRRLDAGARPGRDAQGPAPLRRRSLLECHLRMLAIDMTGLPWIEIDFPEDLERAKESVLPDLHPLNET